MITRALPAALPLGLAILFVATGCARMAPETPAQPTAPAASAAAPASAAEPAPAMAAATTGGTAGADVFKMYCATCHGAAGAGDGLAAASLNPKPTNFAAGAFKYDANGNGTRGEIDDVKAIVRDGAAKYGGSVIMASWPMLSPEQVQAVAEHVKTLHAG